MIATSRTLWKPPHPVPDVLLKMPRSRVPVVLPTLMTACTILPELVNGKSTNIIVPVVAPSRPPDAMLRVGKATPTEKQSNINVILYSVTSLLLSLELIIWSPYKDLQFLVGCFVRLCLFGFIVGLNNI